VKIIVFAPFFPPDPTGSSVFASQQVQELERLGHEVLVVTNLSDKNAPGVLPQSESRSVGGSANTLRLKSTRVNLGRTTWNYSIPTSFRGFVNKMVRLRLRNFDPDIVIIHSTLFDLSLIALLWSAKHRKPSVIVGHTALWHDGKAVNFLLRVYGKLVLGPLIRIAKSKVVCVDKWTFENAVSLFSPPKNTSSIPVSLNLGTMKNGDAERVRKNLPFSEGPVVLSLGHVIPVLRDRLNLVRSLPLLVQRFPNLIVLIVGMVKDDRFLKLADELDVSKHLVVLGAVAHSEIRDYLALADIETHDLGGLGLGITSVEAMDAGVPIVAWAVDDNYPSFSLRSYGDSGFINDGKPETIAGMIIRILSDPGYRSRVIESQHRLVADIYSCEKVTAQYLKLFS
jgi:1,2-diacylglycerol 3-alpha-glucosyltransferase